MEYLLKVSAVVAIFYLSYNLFLQRDTFFEQNRWFLLLGLIIAFIVPYFVIPNYIEYTPTIDQGTNSYNTEVIENIKEPLTFLDLLSFVYIIGTLCFTIRFIVQLTSLGLIIFKKKREKHGRYIYIKTNKNVSPFSFFNWIVYNPNNFTKTELDQIIAHEKVHVNQYHSIDILLTQITCIILWFNPFIWLYNKNLKQNLEFIADKTAQNKVSCKKSYQTTLLKTSIPSHHMVLSNNFYNSLIKKRIVMLHKSKSKKINLLKYVLVIPLLALFLMSFNTEDIYIEKETTIIKPFKINDPLSKNNFNYLLEENIPLIEQKEIISKSDKVKSVAKSEIKKNLNKPSEVIQEKTEVLIDKSATDSHLDKIKASLKEKDITIKFNNINRNRKGEITAIKINVDSKNSNANYNVSGDDPIKPIKILIGDNKNISIANVNSYKINNTGKGSSSAFIISEENMYEINGDTINLINPDEKIKYHVNTKKAKVISNDKKVEVIIESDDILDNKEELILIKEVNEDGQISSNNKVIIRKNSNPKNKIIISEKDSDENNPLIIIDGIERKEKQIKDIDPDNIEMINVLKGDSAIKKYGDKGKDGVVEITTKKK